MGFWDSIFSKLSLPEPNQSTYPVHTRNSALNHFTTAVITGAGSGLGKALAKYLQYRGKKVILVGRTEANLKEASAELNSAPYYVLDVGKVNDIPSVVERIIKEHPEVDSLWNSAGVMKEQQVQELDLASVDQQIDINVRGPIHLATAFLPHFTGKKSALIVNLTAKSGLAPIATTAPVYGCTKAFLHDWTQYQRIQLRDTHVRVLEIVPSAVHTNLRRDLNFDKWDDTDHKEFAQHTLSIDRFIHEIALELDEGKEIVTAGPSGRAAVQLWNQSFGKLWDLVEQNYAKTIKAVSSQPPAYESVKM